MKTSQFYLIAVAVAIVVVLGLLVIFRMSPGPAGQPTATTPPPAGAPAQKLKIANAKEGELVRGFPKELILDANADIGKSYAVNYDPNLNQYTVTFNSNQAMLDVFSSYKDYFSANSWTLVNQVTKYPSARGLYVKKDKAEISVAIIDQQKSRQVTVSYIVK